MYKTTDPQRLTFNRTTLKTKVWRRRTDDPAWDAGGKPLRVYTPESIPRAVFDQLDCPAQMAICNARDRAGIGWREVEGHWHSHKIESSAPRARSRSSVNPHAGRPVRPRGARRPRAQATRSSARSGDSGSEDGEQEPPQDGPPCECGCGSPLTGKRAGARHLNGTHRKRAQRARDRANPNAASERIADHAIEHALPAPAGPCECGGEAAEARDHEWWCVICGHVVAGSRSSVNGAGTPRARSFVTVQLRRDNWRKSLTSDERNELRELDRARGYRLPRRRRKEVIAA